MILLQPWRWITPRMAHDLAPYGLKAWAQIWGEEETPSMKPFDWKGLHFRNRIGIAGGVDKNAQLIPTWQKLGFGFCEIGTVTPRPQSPNPGKVLDRDWNQKLVWNKMGFPSQGSQEVFTRLAADREYFQGPVFVNIGKNRDTPMEKAVEDYVECARLFAPLADALVVNISSPNTSGLRGLQSAAIVRPLLEATIDEAAGTPVLVKLSPDIEADEFAEIVDACAEAKVEGFVLTNTTTARPNQSKFPTDGGLSGKFLAARSLASLKNLQQILANQRSEFLIVSVGGILDPKDVQERLDLGADLVQVYTALIFQGPGFVQQVRKAQA